MAGEEKKFGNKSEVDADWEAAFQAEDFMLDPDAKSADSPFSLGAETGAGQPGKASGQPRLAEAEYKVLAGEKKSESPQGFLARLGGWSGLSMLAGLLPAAVGNKLDEISAKAKGVFLLSLIALFVAFLAFGVGKTMLAKKGDSPHQAAAPVPAPASAPEAPPAATPQTAAPAEPLVAPVVVAPTEETAAEAVVQPPSQPAVAAPPAPSPAAVHAPAQESGDAPEAERRKWRFSSFMISPRVQDEGQPASYVVVDLSLVLRLPADAALPEDSQYRIRDMIYQFYQNRPLYELRRYALARGEMKQKLMEWLRKQWADGPVENVVFHRYKVI